MHPSIFNAAAGAGWFAILWRLCEDLESLVHPDTAEKAWPQCLQVRSILWSLMCGQCNEIGHISRNSLSDAVTGLPRPQALRS
jgi:hypothetical protein